ncbi:hypothetical protein BLA29_006927, partial [Euroglyphus maynei]
MENIQMENNNGMKCKGKKFPIQFKQRESLLTHLFDNDSNLRMIHDLIFLIIIVFLLYKIENFIKEPAKFWQYYDVLIWNLGDFLQVLQIWLIMNISVLCLHYPLVLFNNFIQYRWLMKNDEKNLDILYEMYENGQYYGRLWKIILYTLYSAISIFGILFYCTYSILVYDLKLTGSFSLLLEMTRLLMKSHSFFMEKKDLYIEKESFETVMMNKKSGNIFRSFWSLPSSASFQKFIYFLFAPTLLYRDSYPRTKTIRWKRVLNFVAQFFIFFSLGSYILVQQFVPELKKSCTE